VIPQSKYARNGNLKKNNGPSKLDHARNVNRVTKHIDMAIADLSLRKMNVCRFPGIGFPDQLRTVLRYKENGISFTASTTPAAQVYRMNSLFDPNLTGTGHQPNQFDQLAALYLYYVVTACRVKVQILNEGTVEIDCVLVYTDNNTSTQTVENLSEARWSKNICIGIQSSGKSVANLSLGTASIMNLMGEKDLNTDPSTYAGIGNNPVDPVYAIFKMSAADAITNVKAIANFEIFFDCTFKELSPVTES